MDRDPSPKKDSRGGEVDVLKISNDDAAFILGKNGKTKEKIARVSGAEIDLFEHSLTLEIRGDDAARDRAKKYIECVMAQRVGPVTIDESSHDSDDLTTINVPSEAVGFTAARRATSCAPSRRRKHASSSSTSAGDRGRRRDREARHLRAASRRRGRS